MLDKFIEIFKSNSNKTLQKNGDKDKKEIPEITKIIVGGGLQDEWMSVNHMYQVDADFIDPSVNIINYRDYELTLIGKFDENNNPVVNEVFPKEGELIKANIEPKQMNPLIFSIRPVTLFTQDGRIFVDLDMERSFNQGRSVTFINHITEIMHSQSEEPIAKALLNTPKK